MSPEHQANNIASWKELGASIERHPESAFGTPWKTLARRLLKDGIEAGLNRYFRAGTSVNHLVFSTLDNNTLYKTRLEPRVTVELHPPVELRIAYGKTNLHFRSPDLEYKLEYEPAFATFRRFLNQLWKETVPEPLPEELCGYSAPILTHTNQ